MARHGTLPTRESGTCARAGVVASADRRRRSRLRAQRRTWTASALREGLDRQPRARGDRGRGQGARVRARRSGRCGRRAWRSASCAGKQQPPCQRGAERIPWKTTRRASRLWRAARGHGRPWPGREARSPRPSARYRTRSAAASAPTTRSTSSSPMPTKKGSVSVHAASPWAPGNRSPSATNAAKAGSSERRCA